jgi:hypothetical protein
MKYDNKKQEIKSLFYPILVLLAILCGILGGFVFFNSKKPLEAIVPERPNKIRVYQLDAIILGRAEFAGMEYVMFKNNSLQVINLTKDSLEVELLKQQLNHEH